MIIGRQKHRQKHIDWVRNTLIGRETQSLDEKQIDWARNTLIGRET